MVYSWPAINLPVFLFLSKKYYIAFGQKIFNLISMYANTHNQPHSRN